MMPKKITYPFKAKSTAYLLPGQFWALDLTYYDYAGWYGCGRVLELNGNRRSFLAGLMDWVDTQLPTAESIAGHQVIDQAVSRVNWISGDILGHRNLEEDNLEPLLWLGESVANHHNPNKRPNLMRGLVVLRETTKAEFETLSKKDLVRSFGNVNAYLLESLVLQKMKMEA
jgi:hypothetical protein